jgi:membrane protease YdiL (CAAX protease family)
MLAFAGLSRLVSDDMNAGDLILTARLASMFTHCSDRAKALMYYGITLTLATLVALLPLPSGDLNELLSMCTPLVAVLLMLQVLTDDGATNGGWRALGLRPVAWRMCAIALILPVLAMATTYAILWRTSYADPVMPSKSPLGLIVSLVAGFAITLVFSLSEEVGWRGYLLPHLLALGPRRASLLTGLLHGTFHLPLLLLTSFYHGEGNRLVVVPLFLLALTLSGPIYGYMRLATGSIWPCAVTHAALNVAWGVFAKLTVASSPVAVEYLGGESGVLAVLFYAIVAGWCLYRLGRCAPRMSSPVTADSRAMATGSRR